MKFNFWDNQVDKRGIILQVKKNSESDLEAKKSSEKAKKEKKKKGR